MKTTYIKIALIVGICLALGACGYLCFHYLVPHTPEVPAPHEPQNTSAVVIPEQTVPTQPVTTEPTQVDPPAENDALRLALEDALDGVSSQWVVSCEPLNGGARTVVSKNIAPDAPMVSASIIKIFILGAVYDRIDKGLLAEEDVYDTCFQMITVSSNEAANALTRLLGNGDASVGEQAVNAFAASIGCTGVFHNRLMLEDNGMQNYVSVYDCMKLLRMLYEGSCISPEASEKMLDILKSQKDHDYIPSGVPEGITIAHKGGDLLNLCQGDVGIVFAEGNPYIVCILCNLPNSYDGARAKITELSSLIYEACTAQAS